MKNDKDGQAEQQLDDLYEYLHESVFGFCQRLL